MRKVPPERRFIRVTVTYLKCCPSIQPSPGISEEEILWRGGGGSLLRRPSKSPIWTVCATAPKRFFWYPSGLEGYLYAFLIGLISNALCDWTFNFLPEQSVNTLLCNRNLSRSRVTSPGGGRATSPFLLFSPSKPLILRIGLQCFS